MLCDTGPLLALVDRRSPDHRTCYEIMDATSHPLISTWACFAEAMYMLGRLGGSRFQQQLWSMHQRGMLVLHQHADVEFPRMQVLMLRYENVPMDLADASLMSVAEQVGDRQVFTLDNDFRIYRFDDGGFFDVVP